MSEAKAYQFKKMTDLQYTFRITRRIEPKEVRNLWDLDVKTPDNDTWERIVDADMLSTAIAKINFIFEQDGL